MLGPILLQSSQSLTARERSNPPPRQKSCAACIKSKRRCDSALPSCERCSQRGITCEYPARKRRRAPTSSGKLPGPPSSTVTTDWGTTGGVPSPPMESFGGCIGAIDPLFSSLEPAVTGASNAVPTLQLLDEPDMLPLDFSLDEIETNPLELIHQQSMLAAPTVSEFEVFTGMRERLEYAVDEIKKAPSMMVYEMQTPWCHPRLYDKGYPRSMQDAISCCGLYLAKNRINGRVILRTIEARVSELMATPEPTDSLNLLARTQALLLYHIIRIFDGDITARATAERTQAALEDCALALIPHVDFDCNLEYPTAEELNLDPVGSMHRFWHNWIFQESSRRTLLFVFFFLQIYRVISGHTVTECDGRLGLCHSFTLSSYLWHAEAPTAFMDAWKNKRHLVIGNGDFQEVFHQATADEVDAFGKVLLSTVLGREATESWFASRGASLAGAFVSK